ncbi:MAG: class I SAM-dependent methyltransferase [Akkermansiaceae bacterium]|nr:class I SAM-dependent methyltransferase [Akkermansiaceae bacterium]
MISSLICPQCGKCLEASGLQREDGEIEHGILACPEHEYPVVGGIPVLRFGGPADGQRKRAVELVKAKRYEEALEVMTGHPQATSDGMPLWLRPMAAFPGGRQAARRIRRHLSDRAARRLSIRLMRGPERFSARDIFRDYFKLHFKDGRNAFDYFFYRFGQPRHLAALSVSAAMPRTGKRVLDLACGFGHLTRGLVNCGERTAVGLDSEFFLLYVAKKWVCPEAEFIHADAVQAYPFKDGVFSAVTCCNSFHFFGDKECAWAEIRRVVDESAWVAVISLRNSLVPAPASNTALTPEGYAQLFGDWPSRMVAESEVVERYAHGKGPALAGGTPSRDLEGTGLLTMVASRKEDALRDYGEFSEWPHGRGNVQLNPLFKESAGTSREGVTLVRTSPSPHYEQDNPGMSEYMPDSVACKREDLVALKRHERSAGVLSLIDRFAAFDIPNHYV